MNSILSEKNVRKRFTLLEKLVVKGSSCSETLKILGRNFKRFSRALETFNVQPGALKVSAVR